MSTTKEFKIKVNNNFKDAEKDVEDLNGTLNKTSAASAGVAASANSASASMKALGASKFTGVTSSIGKMVKSLFTLKGAIIGTGIGALLLLVSSLKAAFTRTEAGQNKFAKALGVLGSVFENIMDVVGDVGELLISLFENPMESLKAFGRAIVNNIMARFEGILELIPALGSAISEVFRGNFSNAGKIATNALAKVALGVEDVTGKFDKASSAVSGFFKSISKDGRAAAKIADQRAKAEKLERDLIVQRAKEQAKISELQLKSRQEELFTEEQREKFAKKAAARTDALLKKEEEALRLRFEAIKAENKLADSNKEALEAEANAEADLINLQTRRLDAQKTATKFLNTLRDELTAKNNARRKVEEKATVYGVEFTKKMSNEEIQVLTKAAEAQFKIDEEARKKRIEQQDAQDKLSIDVMQDGIDKEIAKLVAGYDAKFLIAEGNAELEKQLAQKLEDEIIAIKEKTAKKEAKIIKDKGEKEIIDAKKLNASKVDLAAQGFGALANLVTSFEAKDKESAKRQFKVNKALQIGQTIASTAAGIMQQLAVPQDALTGLNFVKAGIVGVTGAASLAKIASSKFDSTSTGGGVDAPSTPSASSAPNINVVGNSGINQIAQLQQQPTQAFVVSSSVTSMQALDRNREQNATL